MLILQVIWVIGASMILLSAVQWLGRRACLLIGVAILHAQPARCVWPPNNLFDEHWPLWVALHAQMAYRAGPFLFLFLYPLLPWIGVMLLGFGVAGVFELPPDRRNQFLLRDWSALTAAFVLLRAFDIYGDPNPWQRQPAA